jgi:cyclopropane-fatty-acyl-phospholipid synthase
MPEQTIAVERPNADPASPSMAAKLLARLVGPVQVGRLTLDLPSGERVVLMGHGPGDTPHVTLHRWRAIRRLVLAGDTGVAEAYRDGDWSTSDLRALLQWGAANFGDTGTVGDGCRSSRLAGVLRHASRANSRRNSRRNTHAHYDLGNAFYAAWLDPSMSYSSGIYRSAGMTLDGAQAAKLDRVVELLAPQTGDKVLEIGCGWGALAERLIVRHDCQVIGLTLSDEQHRYASDRLATAGLAAHADIRLQDYRDITGTFDRIASIEMLEAVGEQYWPAYFAKLHASLAPHGTIVLQVITIAEDRYSSYRARPDFIQKHIFPGGMLPTKSLISRQAAAAGLAVRDIECFGPSYARTLATWRDRFEASAETLAELGFGAEFRRLWSFYFAYCEVGFKRKWLDVSLIRLCHKGG